MVPNLATESDRRLALRVLSDSAEVALFVPEVQRYADMEKDALGFLPASVYEEAAQSQNLLIAVTPKFGLNVYAGHLLFGGRFPHAKVFQIFVAQEFRSKGVASALVDRLVEVVEACSYLSISARVADDLPANGFWEAMKFDLAGVKPGGLSRKRMINVRVMQLNTRTLFSLIAEQTQELGLADRLALREPVYVIDLNVFWDVVHRRPRSPYAAEIVSAALRQLIHVVVTPEFIRELSRTPRPTPSDPALEFAMQLPMLPEPESRRVDSLVTQLAEMVFPARARAGTLSARDRSDLTHLAVAVHHNANGFVTSEDALLRAGDAIHSRYGIEVLHVEKLSGALRTMQQAVPSFRAQLSSDTIYICDLLAGNSSQVESFLKANPAPLEYREDFLSFGSISSDRKRIAVMSETQMVCLASWDTAAGLHARANVRLVADEEHPAVETVLNCVIGKVCNEASRSGPVLLRLLTPSGHVVSKKIAVLYGFRPPELPADADDGCLQKLAVGRPMLTSNWGRVRRTIQQCSGLALQESPPDCFDSDSPVNFVNAAGLRGSLAVHRLEGLLSPTVVVGPGRLGCIAPIRRAYSDRLLQASQQMLLHPNREAALFSERVYFSSARNLRVLASNAAILFYESGGGGGRASVVAVARVRSSERHTKMEISSEMLRHGVLDSDGIKELTAFESIAVTTFDAVIPFERPVPLDRLRQLGCVDGSNLVCAKPLANEQLVAILEEGFLLG